MGKYILLSTSFSKSTEYRWIQTMLHYVNQYRLIFSIYLGNSIGHILSAWHWLCSKWNVSFCPARAFLASKFLEFYSIYLLCHYVPHIQTHASKAYATKRSIQYGHPKKWFYVNSRNYNKIHPHVYEFYTHSVSISRI